MPGEGVIYDPLGRVAFLCSRVSLRAPCDSALVTDILAVYADSADWLIVAVTLLIG